MQSGQNRSLYPQLPSPPLNISTCEECGVWMFGMHEDSDAGDSQAEDGVVHLELSPRHRRDEVGAVLSAAAEQNLRRIQ